MFVQQEAGRLRREVDVYSTRHKAGCLVFVRYLFSKARSEYARCLMLIQHETETICVVSSPGICPLFVRPLRRAQCSAALHCVGLVASLHPEMWRSSGVSAASSAGLKGSLPPASAPVFLSDTAHPTPARRAEIADLKSADLGRPGVGRGWVGGAGGLGWLY